MLLKAYTCGLPKEAKDIASKALNKKYGSVELKEVDANTNSLPYYRAIDDISVVLVVFNDETHLEKSKTLTKLYESDKYLRFNNLNQFHKDLEALLGISIESSVHIDEEDDYEETIIPTITSEDDLSSFFNNLGTANTDLSLEYGTQQVDTVSPAVVGSPTTYFSATEVDANFVSRTIYENMSKQNNILTGKNNLLSNENASLKAENTKFRQMLLTAKTSIELLNETVAGLQSNSIPREQYSSIQSELVSTKEELLTYRTNNLELKTSNSDLLEKVDNLTKDNSSLLLSLKDRDAEVQSLKSDLDIERSKRSIDDIAADLENLKRKYDEKLNVLESENKDLQSKLLEANNRILSSNSVADNKDQLQFTKFKDIHGAPPPIKEIYRKNYKNLTFIFSGSSTSIREGYRHLESEVKRRVKSGKNKVILVDLSINSFSYYRFQDRLDKKITKGAEDWLINGGDIHKYSLQGKGNGRDYYYYFSNVYINDNSFYFFDWDARLSELNAMGEDVIIYFGDATSGIGKSFLASLNRNNKVTLQTSGDIFSMISLINVLNGLKISKENAIIQIFDFTTRISGNYAKALKEHGFKVDMLNRKVGS